MPKAAFHKISEEKRDIIIKAALSEFGSNSYKESSLNNIVKITKIPKGSFYKYFEDKLDIYKYTLNLATEKNKVFF